MSKGRPLNKRARETVWLGDVRANELRILHKAGIPTWKLAGTYRVTKCSLHKLFRGETYDGKSSSRKPNGYLRDAIYKNLCDLKEPLLLSTLRDLVAKEYPLTKSKHALYSAVFNFVETDPNLERIRTFDGIKVNLKS